jgi:hypothetical protein
VRNSARKFSALVLAVLLAQMMACASNTGTLKSGVSKPTVKGAALKAAGFKPFSGGDWYYPPTGYPHIHLIAPYANTRDSPQTVTEIAISWGGNPKNPNLVLCASFNRYNLDTPGINWGANEDKFKDVLVHLGVAAEDC